MYMCAVTYSVTLIRGEPERAPNTRVTYGEFAVPMYVCIYVCIYVCTVFIQIEAASRIVAALE